ncbi:MAG: efflux RND transporter periplasmic adaptor subunit [Candidatus Latescibacteria bacterium]|nr:efflux RND transporter periplasmic adaptor subunit [Candidatus Latescibacterota bacterium]
MKFDFCSKFLLVIILCGIVACDQQAEQRTVDLTVPVTVQSVETGTIESIVTATGTLRPVREAQIMTEIRGSLYWSKGSNNRLLAKGSEVRRGQTIARLDSDEWVVGARVEARKLAVETAKRTLKEQETLFSRQLATEMNVENARKAWADAEANYQDALIKIDKTRLLAPIQGVMSELADITQGTLVTPNTTIAKIDLKIPNAQIINVKLGQGIRVSNYALPEEVFEGEIVEMDPAIDPVTRTVQVVGMVDNPDLLLRAGMFVKAEIVTESRQNVVLIARNLVLRRRNQKVVFVEEEGRAQQREVETGLEDRDRVEIVIGLDPGDQLITSNYETLRPRTRVRVTGDRR